MIRPDLFWSDAWTKGVDIMEDVCESFNLCVFFSVGALALLICAEDKTNLLAEHHIVI